MQLEENQLVRWLQACFSVLVFLTSILAISFEIAMKFATNLKFIEYGNTHLSYLD